MTVCIAALCENGSACVIAADRMGSLDNGGGFSLTADDQCLKLHKISNRTVLLHSGKHDDALMIVKKVKERIHKSKLSPHELVDSVALELLQEQREEMAARLLGSGITFDSLVNGAQSPVVGNVVNLIQQMNVGKGILVSWAGSLWGMHVINPPSRVERFGLPYGAIGTGMYYAVAALNAASYRIDSKLPEAMLEVTMAKMAAESGYAVGQRMDMMILTKKSVKQVEQGTIDLLSKLVKERRSFKGSPKSLEKIKKSVSLL